MMDGLNVEHVLIFVVVVFVLYHFGCRCSCGNGFRVGGEFPDWAGLKWNSSLWLGDWSTVPIDVKDNACRDWLRRIERNVVRQEQANIMYDIECQKDHPCYEMTSGFTCNNPTTARPNWAQ